MGRVYLEGDAASRAASMSEMFKTHHLTLLLTLGCTRATPTAPETAAIAAASVSPAMPIPSATPAPTSSESRPVDGTLPKPATSVADVASAPGVSAIPLKPAGKARGASCGGSAQCKAGLSCCQTDFRGHCGGAFEPDQPPCILLSTRAPPPLFLLTFLP